MRVVAQCSGKEFTLYQNTGLQHAGWINTTGMLLVKTKNSTSLGVVVNLTRTHVVIGRLVTAIFVY